MDRAGEESVVIGVVINPIAGYGARLAMHGTGHLDAEQYRAALVAGRATDRMRRALERFAGRLTTPPVLVAVPGVMGGGLLERLGLAYRRVGSPVSGPTTSQATIEAARRIVETGVDCLAFSGGDGTAADLADQVGVTPLVGVPAGVKMHSGSFARSPEGAGDLLAAVAERRVSLERQDLLDVVDDRGPQVVGSVWVPAAKNLLQGAKAASRGDDAGALRALGPELLAKATPDAIWILGPGTSVAVVAEAMGLSSPVTGFTVADRHGVRVADATERDLLDLASLPDLHLLLGVVGGQGFLLGRGNHELSADVLARLDPTHIHIVASESKLAALHPAVLHVDLGDVEPAAALDGYRPVHVGPGRTMLMKVVSSAGAESLT